MLIEITGALHTILPDDFTGVMIMEFYRGGLMMHYKFTSPNRNGASGVREAAIKAGKEWAISDGADPRKLGALFPGEGVGGERREIHPLGATTPA